MFTLKTPVLTEVLNDVGGADGQSLLPVFMVGESQIENLKKYVPVTKSPVALVNLP